MPSPSRRSTSSPGPRRPRAARSPPRRTNTPPHDTLGYILLEKGETKAALAEFEAAQKIFGTDPRVDLHIAMASLRLGDLDRARRLFNGLREDAVEFSGPDELDWRALEREMSDAR